MCKSEIMLRWIQALGLPTLVVGGLGLLIARWQIQTAREKLRHELYERRLAIYLAFHDLILAVSEKDTVEVELRKANAARAQAPFLLNPKVNPQIARFLAELEHEAFQIDRTAKRVRDESLWEFSQERISMAGLLTQNKLAFTRRIRKIGDGIRTISSAQ